MYNHQKYSSTPHHCICQKMNGIKNRIHQPIRKLIPHKVLSLEQALDFIENDELVEVTPKNIRIRKKILDPKQRMRANKK